MKKISKILSVVLVFLMVVSIIPITASAATYSGTCGDNLTWTYNTSDGYLTISGTGAMYDYKLNNRPWESYEDDIKVIVVEDGVTTIGTYAFYHCGKLVTATLPDSVTSIGEYVFRECKKLKSINIPDGVKIIKPHTFNYCGSLEQITIPNGVIEIGQSAFYGCDGLIEITIPDSVTTIGETTFEYCDNLTNVTFGEGLTVIDKFAFAYCTSLKNVTIPSNVTSIETGAFAGCESLLNITVDSNNPNFSNDENGILFNKDKTILIQYTLGSDVAEYTIPDSVTQIGRWSFYSCSKLSELTIPNSVTVIGNSAFSYKQTVIIYYEGTAEQWNNALEKNSGTPTHWSDDYYIICSDKTIYPSGTCGENVTWVFNKVTGVLTISGTGEMDNYNLSYTGFYGQPWESFSNSVKEVVIEDGVTTIGDCAFASFDNLTTINIPNSVTTIGKEALYHCDNLSNVTIGDSVTAIGEKAFYYCTSLTSIVIPINLTSIGNDAFTGCSGVTDVYYEGTEEQWDDNFVIYNGYLVPPKGPFEDAKIHYNHHIHRYTHSSVVTAPTCTEQGYTTYTCECGETYIEYIDAIGHNYTKEITTPATHTTTGVMTYTCHCGDTYTETIEKLAEHNYESVVTAPTCTEQGYTTYTCECGDTYIDDCVDALGHTPANSIEENYVVPTCTANGSKDVVINCSVCDEEISRETVTLEATGHTDVDNDGYCDNCDEQLCDHNCHKSGIAGFIWKIICFVNRIFGTNKYCKCGVTHY